MKCMLALGLLINATDFKSMIEVLEAFIADPRIGSQAGEAIALVATSQNS